MMNEWTSPDGRIRLINADSLDVLPQLEAGSVDAVVTDPPYPDYLTEEYCYFDGILEPLRAMTCRQFVFWSGRVDFPLPYSAVHIWNKNPSNHGAQYERVFERNGGSHQKVFTYYMVNSTVAAQMTRDVRVEHPSQKPVRLMVTLCQEIDAETILDPFAGSCTTAIACIRTNRRCIAIEKERKYWEIGVQRCKDEYARTVLFNDLEAVA